MSRACVSLAAALLISALALGSVALAAPAEEYYVEAEFPPAKILEKNFCKSDPACKYLGNNETTKGQYLLFFMVNNRLAYDQVSLVHLNTNYWVMDIKGGWKGLLLR